MEEVLLNVSNQDVDHKSYIEEFVAGPISEERSKQFMLKEEVEHQGPLVSVLLACYNHEAYVEEAVMSVLSQKGVSFELIVVDDGSSDKSSEILERLSKEHKFRYIHRENRGIISTLNEMLCLAQGKYFCTFASDDKMPPERLLKQSLYLENHPDKVACFGQVIPMSADGVVGTEMDKTFRKSVPSISFDDIFLGIKGLHGCSEMFRRETVLELGGYNPRFFFEDLPLYLALLRKHGPQPVLPDVVCCYYRIHGTNLHKNHERMYTEILRIIGQYQQHHLYKKAVAIWKAKWFSVLAGEDKKSAFKKFPKLASCSLYFWTRAPKLLIPKFLLRRS